MRTEISTKFEKISQLKQDAESKKRKMQRDVEDLRNMRSKIQNDVLLIW